MAVISGTDGDVTFPTGVGGKLVSWTATVSQNLVDTTGFDDDVWGTGIGANNLKMRGNASGFCDTSKSPKITTTMSASGIAMTLIADANHKYAGTFLISDVQIGSTRIGAAQIQYNFESTGALVETWTTT